MLTRFLLFFLILSLPLAAQQAGQENGLDSNPALFTMFLARAAAGYDGPAAPDAHPARAGLIARIQSRHPASLDALKTFFAQHLGRTEESDQAQYVSFALSITGPPDFAFRYEPQELAPDVQKLVGLEKLLRTFWSEAGLAEQWKNAAPVYDQVLDEYHSPVTQSIFQVNAYLRNPTSGYLGRRFQVFVDITGPPGLMQSRSFKDDYFVVVTPAGNSMAKVDESVAAQVPEIRHAYLHYVLDPLVIKFAEIVNQKISLEDISEGIEALPVMYRQDFGLLTTESLIKAVEARLAPASEREHIVDTALHQGYILTPYFAEALPAYEKQQQSMRLYAADLFGQIDVEKETSRLAHVKFDAPPPQEKAAAPPPQLKPGEQALSDAESLSFDKKYDKAKEAFEHVLQLPDTGGLHARAYFGLGRIAVLQKDPELGEKLFQKTLDEKPDAVTESWTKLYLGRLAAAAGEDQQAVAFYRAAAAVDGGSPKAKAEAEKLIASPDAGRPR